MRFLSINFRRFGPFEDKTLDLSSGTFGLHFILGANEAGKTTALRGLGFLLFGFPHAVCDAYRFAKHAEQRIGAKFTDRTGNELGCRRRRGTKKSLHDFEDKSALPDSWMLDILNGLDREQFEMLFGLGHDLLVNGGKEIVEGKGGIGAALFAAGAGLAGMRRLDGQISERIEGLYKKKAQNLPINKTLSEWQDQRDQLREATLRIDAYQTQEAIAHENIARRDALIERRKLARTEIEQLKNIRIALPMIDALHDRERQLANLTNAPRLPDTFGADLQKANDELLLANDNRRNALKEIECIEADLKPLCVETVLLAEEPTIDRLKTQLGVCFKAESDRLGLYARMREHQGNARNILRKYFKQEDLDYGVKQLEFSQAEINRIRQLGEQRQALHLAVKSAHERIATLDEEIIGLEHRQRNLQVQVDVSALNVIVQSITSKGPLEMNLNEIESKLAIDERKAKAILKRLGDCWSGELDQIPELRVPLAKSISLHQQEFKDFVDAERLLSAQIQKNANMLRDRKQKIDLLLREGKVATKTDVHDARVDRNNGLELIRDEWLHGSAERVNREAFIQNHAPGRHLLDALKASILDCDDLADQILAETDRSVKLSNYQNELLEAERESAVLVSEKEALRERFEHLMRAWQGEWQASNISPKLPAEMSEWLQEFSRLRLAVEELRTLGNSVEDKRQRLEECKASLRCALSMDNATNKQSLEELLACARQQIDAATAKRNASEQIGRELAQRQQDRQKEARRLRSNEDELAAWKREWGQAILGLQLDESAEPSTVNQLLDQIAEMFRELRERVTLEIRIKGIDRDRDQFLVALNALRQRIDGSDHSPSTVETMQVDMDGLQRRLMEAGSAQTRRNLLEQRLEQSKQALAAFEQQILKIGARLELLRQEAGAANIEDIRATIQRGAERQRIEKEIDEERRRIRNLAPGQRIEIFIAVAVAARNDLDMRLIALEEEIGKLDDNVNEHAILADRAEKQLATWRQASSDAAEIRQKIESSHTRLREQATEFTILHLSRQVLRQTIERYRQKNQNTMLSRAEHYFRTLTNDAFLGLDIDENEEGQAILRARRKYPEEFVEVNGLSDGTRDQLFLSLRLAGIEQHIESREPMPLIVDDVLVNFDDARSVATLKCLADISKKTQVLFFTHHEHLLDLAQSIVPKDTLFVQRLSS